MTLEDFADLLNNLGIMPLPENTTFDTIKNNEEYLRIYAYFDGGIQYNLQQHLRNNRLF